jgi:thioredoxin-related protein
MEAESFTQPEINKFLTTNFIPIRVDVDKERKVASTYHVRSLPVSWFLEPNGERITSIPGYVNPDLFSIILKYIASGSYKTLTLMEFKKQSTK